MRSPFRILRSALHLDTPELDGALRAFGWLAIVRAAVRVVPYARLTRAIRRVPPRRDRARRLTPEQCRGAIDRAARLAPGSTCLSRALAADCLLRREGHRSALALGVRKSEDGQLRAHAWIDSDGVRVAGGDEAGQYQQLAARRSP